ncbi:MAG: tRNA (adenosine(37)-N6)-threonylcarbamoyltransferase complex ATPase subunit type 1 TsaE [Spartobacteria bacterium]|nr:tRNA (adenosine(37)-N6)-threonylcarbamoyltransferase complex ATPase subunit type 1 TsaE [Spartobacteria bacterium]
MSATFPVVVRPASMCFHSTSPEQTEDIASAFAKTLQKGDVVAFHAEMGAGKTCFTRGLAAGLHAHSRVSSPTFTLVNEYEADIPIYHIDLYRLNDPQEAINMGLDEYLCGDGVTLIEWSERGEALLPASTIHITITPGKHQSDRTLRIDYPETAPC